MMGVAVGTSGSSSSSVVDSINSSSNASGNSKEARMESMAAMEIAKWNEFDLIQDFAQQCYHSANEAIQRLSTDRLSDSANLTVHDGMSGDVGGSGNNRDGNHQAAVPGGDAALNHHHDQSQTTMPTSTPTAGSVGPSSSSSSASAAAAAQSSSSMLPRTLADAGIGRCYKPLTVKIAGRVHVSTVQITHGQMMRLITQNIVQASFLNSCGDQWVGSIHDEHDHVSILTTDGTHIIPTPTYASGTPHPFPSLEAVHCLQYLVSELLHTSIPSSINKFRAATEANAVVSKRLYLVKCEYRAPMRALWESYTALNAAPSWNLWRAICVFIMDMSKMLHHHHHHHRKLVEKMY
ncbi:hypothetical protein QTG54_002521 [Skeletonema marinoi]|uniref:Uncharacterized protein n=1 Tax=Skeletonema marinoi TaxID=267567 RepID=A0AAD9DHB6_9STRA|nr:hypothetical protein QTG54_002521 [Skeletonema marinoi]